MALPTIAATQDSEAEPRSLAALRIDEPITLDGVLDEEVWSRAEVGRDFIQREPATGQPGSEVTEVRVVYTARTLYIGITAYDSNPGRIIANEMERDGLLHRDDSVTVTLDTFESDRNAYLFDTNSNAARTDGLITDEGRNWNIDWDGVWDVASVRTNEGWSTELAIPFSTMRFDPSSPSWGLQVRRFIRHKNEEVYWAPLGLDADIMRISQSGRLTGIADVNQGLSLNVKPFVVGTLSTKGAGEHTVDDETIELGGDLKWGVTRGLSLDLTVNTDFGETEVDAQQVNLTRFSLFYPEKREFFLENAGLFDFGGETGTLGASAPLLKVFHSRRIGIGIAGDEIPIDWGARLTGRVGEWNIGLLNVQTGEALLLDQAVPQENNAAARVRRNIGQRSSVGLIFTDRREDNGGTNSVFGADVDIRPRPELRITSYYTMSDDSEVEGGDDYAGAAAVTWKGPIWGWNVDYTQIGDDFRPDMGFLLRRNVRRYTSRLTYEPRMATPKINNLHFQFRGQIYENLDDGEVESEDFTLDLFGIRFNSLNQVLPFVTRQTERLFNDFEIVPGVVIPAGEYTFDFYGASFTIDDTRRFAFAGSLLGGEFYDGDRLNGALTFRARANRHFQSETTWEHNKIDLQGGSFDTNVVRQTFGVFFSPTVLTNTFIQYNDLAELFSVNVRFNWIYRPGADLFVVFNQTWRAPSLSDMDNLDRKLIVKFTYLFQW